MTRPCMVLPGCIGMESPEILLCIFVLLFSDGRSLGYICPLQSVGRIGMEHF